MTEPTKPLLAALAGKRQNRPPFWFMRQAGRYLPEYREIRAKAGDFLQLVYNPELACEVTLQPLRRYGMDAAILFSDILVVPHAMGQNVSFAEGEGPRLDPIRDLGALTRLPAGRFHEKASLVYESVARIRQSMTAEGFTETTLIGFAGSPWTIACYMVEGGGSRDFIQAKSWAYRDPEGFGQLIDAITEMTIAYLSGQIDAGAEAVQLFDSWAGVLDETLFRRWVIAPTRKIVEALRLTYPHIPVIGFPRGAGRLYQDYGRDTTITAVSLDYQISPRWAASALQPMQPVQGNLDPVCLLTGGDSLVLAVETIMGNLSMGPFIFNLGHGIIKETPPEHVALLADMIKSYG